MTNHTRKFPVLLTVVVALTLAAKAPEAWAQGQSGKPIEFDEAEIFFEFNSTDLDLGTHIFFDAVGWQNVTVTGPGGTIFEVSNDGALSVIGSTEVFTESAEPPLDEENLEAEIAAFLAMFPEGEYLFEGTTVDGDPMEGTADLSHALPAAPGLIFPDPEADENVADPDNTVIEWADTSGPEDPEIVRYQVVVEFESKKSGDVFEFKVDVPADSDALSQSVDVSAAYFEGLEGIRGDYKAEVVAIADGLNATIAEVEFELE